MRAAGLRAGPHFDVQNGAQFDLHDPRVRRQVRRWIAQRRAWYVHLGAPCTDWSQAQTAKKSRREKWLSQKALQFTVTVLQWRRRFNVVWSIENPLSSKLWLQPSLVKEMAKHSTHHIVLDCCAYYAVYKKPTRISTNFVALSALNKRRPGNHQHEPLRGWARLPAEDGRLRSYFLTTLAGRYAPELCRQWAALAAANAPVGAKGHGAGLGCPAWEASLAAAVKQPLVERLKDPVCPAGWPREWPKEAVC